MCAHSDPRTPRRADPRGASRSGWNWARVPAQDGHGCSGDHSPPGGSRCQCFLGTPLGTPAPDLGSGDQRLGGAPCRDGFAPMFPQLCCCRELSSALPSVKLQHQHEIQGGGGPPNLGDPQPSAERLKQRFLVNTRGAGAMEVPQVSILFSVLFLNGSESVNSSELGDISPPWRGPCGRPCPTMPPWIPDYSGHNSPAPTLGSSTKFLLISPRPELGPRDGPGQGFQLRLLHQLPPPHPK